VAFQPRGFNIISNIKNIYIFQFAKINANLRLGLVPRGRASSRYLPMPILALILHGVIKIKLWLERPETLKERKRSNF
jgi:hypothetical protein